MDIFLLELNILSLVILLPPDPAHAVLMELQKMDLKDYHKKVEDQECNKGQSLCTDPWTMPYPPPPPPTTTTTTTTSIHDHIEASDEWPERNNALNTLCLLQIIWQSFYHSATRWKDTHALINADFALHYFQTNRMHVQPRIP